MIKDFGKIAVVALAVTIFGMAYEALVAFVYAILFAMTCS